jgi:hypothetical protein
MRAATLRPRADGWLLLAALAASVLALLVPRGVHAQTPPARDGAEEAILVFAQHGCPHCERAAAWLDELVARRPGLRVVRRDILEDPEALADLRALSAAHGVSPLAVPAMVVRGRLLVGFGPATPETIEALLDGHAEEGASAAGFCGPGHDPDDPGCEGEHADVVTLPLFGEVSARDLGLPIFTLAVGLVDGFNPCAMWVLLFLLSMLANLHDRARMAWIAGVFVVVSGAIYFAFMAAWLEAYLVIGLSRTLQVVLGLFALFVAGVHTKDFFAMGTGPSLSIPASAKPGIYARVRGILRAEHLGAALAMVTTLAVIVNFIELLCTAGLPALYTQVLAAHGLERLTHYAYLALYTAAYMADDTVMVVIGVATLSQRKLQERGGRWLKLVSGVVVGVLGLLLLFAPELLLWG